MKSLQSQKDSIIVFILRDKMSIQEKSDTPLTALVFGATGVSGWGLCKQLAEYRTPGTFGKIILLSLQPTSIQEAYLPTDEKITLHNGIDLNKPLDNITQDLAQVPGITEVTHVFYNGLCFLSRCTGKIGKLEDADISLHSLWDVTDI
jgi:hypothetical protein